MALINKWEKEEKNSKKQGRAETKYCVGNGANTRAFVDAGEEPKTGCGK